MLSIVQILSIFVIVSVVQIEGYLKDKPDYIPTCRKKDKDFLKCSTASVQKLFDGVKNGIPEIHLAATDPLIIPRIEILQGGEGPVSVNCSLQNVTIQGFGTAKVLFNSVHPQNFDFVTKMLLRNMRIEGIYDLFGRILVLPMKGSGRCWFEASNMTMEVYTDADLYSKDKFSFYNVTGAHVKYEIGGLKLYMGNLFDGLKTLEQSTNEFLNENWRPAAESLRPVLTKTIEDIILRLLKQIFDNVPADYFVEDIADEVPFDLTYYNKVE